MLRVDRAHAGKHARCPECETLNLIPNQDQGSPSFSVNDNIEMESLDPGREYHEIPGRRFLDSGADGRLPIPSPSIASTDRAMQNRLLRHPQSNRATELLMLSVSSIICNIFFLVPGVLACVFCIRELDGIRLGRIERTGIGFVRFALIFGILSNLIYLTMFVAIVLNS